MAADDLEQLEIEAEAPKDGQTYKLITDVGEADIAVPPVNKWRASARRLLISMGDDLGWAQATLSPEDYAAYAELDPTAEESASFFEAVLNANGENLGKSPKSTGPSKITRRR